MHADQSVRTRDADRRPYEPYIRYRHTGAVYRTGAHPELCLPYPVYGR